MEDGDSANTGVAGFLGMPLPGASSGFLIAPSTANTSPPPVVLQPAKPPPDPNDAPP